MEVGIRELKLRLSRYLEQVRAGQTVTVTDRGKPVARIQPIESAEPPAAIRHLLEAGLLIDKGPPRRPLRPVKMLSGDNDKTTTDYVREQRR